MKRALVAIALAGCGGGTSLATGTYQVAWSLDDTSAAGAPTCTSYQIADVVVTFTETGSGETGNVSFPCAAGMGDVIGVPIGNHQITLEAIGTAGDVAGDIDLTGALTSGGQIVTLAPAVIDILPPVTASHTTWTLRAAGAAASCTEIQNTGVAVTTTGTGVTPVTDIWDCDEPNATVDIAYGDFSVKADLLGNGSAVIGTSQLIAVDAGRGTLAIPVTIDAN